LQRKLEAPSLSKTNEARQCQAPEHRGRLRYRDEFVETVALQDDLGSGRLSIESGEDDIREKG
jgi:hypothetical protein